MDESKLDLISFSRIQCTVLIILKKKKKQEKKTRLKLIFVMTKLAS